LRVSITGDYTFLFFVFVLYIISDFKNIQNNILREEAPEIFYLTLTFLLLVSFAAVVSALQFERLMEKYRVNQEEEIKEKEIIVTRGVAYSLAVLCYSSFMWMFGKYFY